MDFLGKHETIAVEHLTSITFYMYPSLYTHWEEFKIKLIPIYVYNYELLPIIHISNIINYQLFVWKINH